MHYRRVNRQCLAGDLQRVPHALHVPKIDLLFVGSGSARDRSSPRERVFIHAMSINAVAVASADRYNGDPLSQGPRESIRGLITRHCTNPCNRSNGIARAISSRRPIS
jgi:hypothetical protein